MADGKPPPRPNLRSGGEAEDHGNLSDIIRGGRVPNSRVTQLRRQEHRIAQAQIDNLSLC